MWWTGIVWTDATSRTPGQVPRRPAGKDTSSPFTMPTVALEDPHRWVNEPPTCLNPSSVAKGLGLPPQDERLLSKTVAEEARAASNGLDFRKGLMSWLYSRHPAHLRRIIMSRAANYYDNVVPQRRSVGDYRNVGPPNRLDSVPGLGLRKSRGGKYTAKSVGPDGKTRYSYRKSKDGAGEGHDAKIAQMNARIKALFEDGPVKLEKLVPFIRDYGQEAVTAALQEVGELRVLGDEMYHKSANHGRASLPSTRPRYVGGAPVPPAVGSKLSRSEDEDADPDDIKKAAPPLPVPGDTGGVAQSSEGPTGRTGPKGLPVGSKKIWNQRIVTKMADGKWHVTGHVAGLEGEAVPSKRFKNEKDGGVPLNIRSLSADQAKALIKVLEKLKGDKDKKPTKKEKTDG